MSQATLDEVNRKIERLKKWVDKLKELEVVRLKFELQEGLRNVGERITPSDETIQTLVTDENNTIHTKLFDNRVTMLSNFHASANTRLAAPVGPPKPERLVAMPSAREMIVGEAEKKVESKKVPSKKGDSRKIAPLDIPKGDILKDDYLPSVKCPKKKSKYVREFFTFLKGMIQQLPNSTKVSKIRKFFGDEKEELLANDKQSLLSRLQKIERDDLMSRFKPDSKDDLCLGYKILTFFYANRKKLPRAVLVHFMWHLMDSVLEEEEDDEESDAFEEEKEEEKESMATRMLKTYVYYFKKVVKDYSVLENEMKWNIEANLKKRNRSNRANRGLGVRQAHSKRLSKSRSPSKRKSNTKTKTKRAKRSAPARGGHATKKHRKRHSHTIKKPPSLLLKH